MKRIRLFAFKGIALKICILLLLETWWPTLSYALTSGPSQPEVQSFEPVSTTQMVDPFTGDFSYNIPLLDVDGYPVNISYHSGITMDQEASWVGLGWNLNPGVINRNMRGIPDDFKGDKIKKEINMKVNRTFGVGTSLSMELFGFFGLSQSLGIRYNNYTGLGIDIGLGVSVGVSLGSVAGLNAGLGINSSSDGGLTLQPSVSLSIGTNLNEKNSCSITGTIGCSYNSRAGLTQYTISVSSGYSYGEKDDQAKIRSINDHMGSNANSSNDDMSFSKSGYGCSGTFSLVGSTFSPMINYSMVNTSVTASFKMGGEVYGIFGNVGVSGSYSEVKLAEKEIENKAYGYLYSDASQFGNNSIHDFNREKDGNFTMETPSLPLANYTYDIYSVSGQGTGGSFRPFRGNVGFVYDPDASTTSGNYSLGFDLGAGGWAKIGVDLSATLVNGSSGKWRNANSAANYIQFHTNANDPLYEKVYFKEANEKTVESDPDYLKNMGGTDPQRFDMDEQSKFDTRLKYRFVDNQGATIDPPSEGIVRKKRDYRTQSFSYLTRDEYDAFAVEKEPGMYAGAQGHHIAEITTLGGDGSRYVYGLPAYNTDQKEITFAVGAKLGDILPGEDLRNGDQNFHEGLIYHTTNEVDKDKNDKGIDNYYSSTTTPPYAYSYLLTSVLSSDYVDADNVRGPSDGDLGSYTKFEYEKNSDNFSWRTPVGGPNGRYDKAASLNEGLKSDFYDDKANIVEGTKQVFYLDKIITKNYVAKFYKSPRCDAREIAADGTMANGKSEKLDSIALFAKKDYLLNGDNALPVKKVIFEYTYDLCSHVPNNDGSLIPENLAKGKLTLKKIYFMYEHSYKARLSPYVFAYVPANFHDPDNNSNNDYSRKSYDRWGYYKPTPANNGLACPGPLITAYNSNLDDYLSSLDVPTAEYPYVDQTDLNLNDYYTAWNLSEISLPSGGKINVEYEADDYAYVQDQPAGEMFRVVDYTTDLTPNQNITERDFNQDDIVNHSTYDTYRFYFKLRHHNDDLSNYLGAVGNRVYFRFLVNILDIGGPPPPAPQTARKRPEYVSGYADISESGYDDNHDYGYIKLSPVSLNDDLSPYVNPIHKAAIQYGRLNMPQLVWGNDVGIGEADNPGLDILMKLINANPVKNMVEAMVGPNVTLHGYNVAREFYPAKSWFRLCNPDGKKVGGGCRVKNIKMNDAWNDMVTGANFFEYGQTFEYKLEDGRSSGVAAYEPMIGGDENPLHKPVFFETRHLLVPDDQHYMEEPFGESFYPAAVVGYSRVTVTNLSHSHVNKHATGKTVYEFYTARDFPVIPRRTRVEPDHDKKDGFQLLSLFYTETKDYFTGSEGFSIELNDMHGKPKSTSVYQEGQADPITQTKYMYKKQPYKTDEYRLDNSCTSVDSKGNVNTSAQIGVYYDMVADFRESKNDVFGINVMFNFDIIPLLFGIPTPIPMIIPSVTVENTQFRSATTTKVIQRFGILDEVEVTDLGSKVSTKNMAYDEETGNVLLTKVTNEFNDDIYNLKIPAYWYYKNMGPAARNIGYTTRRGEDINFLTGTGTVANAPLYFLEGDEIVLSGNGGATHNWIVGVTQNSITVMDKTGANTTINGPYNVKVIRSGYRNQTNESMAMLTSHANPLTGISSNLFENVLQAKAVEYANTWRTYCDCFTTDVNDANYTVNPFILGSYGNWRPSKTYAYLTDRSHSLFDNNTNVRSDGSFNSFSPFYKFTNGRWTIDRKNWTYASEVTEFSPFGWELENKDRLDLYSSAMYGYRQTLPTAVAKNARYKEIGFDGFEDYDMSPCLDNHFKSTLGSNTLSSTVSHSGKHSLKVLSGQEAFVERQITDNCPDERLCHLDLTSTHPALYYLITPSGGVEPYSLSWNVIEGNPTVSLVNSLGVALKIVPPAAGNWKIDITLTDSKGCQLLKQFKN